MKYDYWEIRVEKSIESIVSIKNEEVVHTKGSYEGKAVRVLLNGSWGFASGTGSIEELLKRAERLARLQKGKSTIEPPAAVRKEIIEKFVESDIETKVKELLKGSKRMETAGISARILSCTDIITNCEFTNSEGAEIIQESGYAYLSCSSISKNEKTMQRGSERTWSRSGFHDLDILKAADSSREKALMLLNANPPPKGTFDVILDPEMTGVFTHEAIGHACEGDSIVDQESILNEKVGQKIGSELVTIYDDPTAKDFGHYVYDEEGVLGKKISLIENGILVGYLNSLETSLPLKQPPNGHARAEGYAQVPIVRMSNTYFKPGKSSLDDLFDIDGIYLKGMKGGSVDTFSGGFMFKAEEAWEIKKGEKTKLLRDVTISGNILETMDNVSMVANDFGTSPGICGKFGQSVPVSDGGPHIQVKGVSIG